MPPIVCPGPIRTERSGSVTEAHLPGPKLDLGGQTLETVAGQLSSLATELRRGTLLLNFTNVDSLTGAALAKFLALNNRLRDAGGRLVLHRLIPPLYQVFEVTNLTRVLDIRHDASELLKASPTDRDTALVVAFNQVRSELVGTLTGMLGNRDDAQDAVQIAFLRCWQARDSLADVRDLQAWIWRIGLNAAKDIRRTAWRRRSRPLDRVEEEPSIRQASPDAILAQRERLERLRVAVEGLRSEEKDVFLLRQQADLTFEQIADLRHSPVGTVKTRMRNAMNKLRQTLQVEEKPRSEPKRAAGRREEKVGRKAAGSRVLAGVG